jgi:hypothetical protein
MLAAWALAGAIPAAAADDPQPTPTSAIAQYIEMVPTASGSVAAGRGTGTAKIPPATERQIEEKSGANAKLLTKVVSSEAYGAPSEYQAPPAEPTPTNSAPAPVRPKRPAAKPKPAAAQAPKPLARAPVPPAPNPLSAAFGTLGDGGALFVLALTCAIGVGVGARFARNRPAEAG